MLAFAQYLKISKGSTVYASWQNYYVGETIELSGLSYTYQAFEADGIEAGDLESESSLSVIFTTSTDVTSLLINSLRQAFVVEINTYAFDPRQERVGEYLVGTYIGQIIGAQRTSTQMILQLGATLSPVGSQVPPRKFTSRLIGAPCRLD